MFSRRRSSHSHVTPPPLYLLSLLPRPALSLGTLVTNASDPLQGYYRHPTLQPTEVVAATSTSILTVPSEGSGSTGFGGTVRGVAADISTLLLRRRKGTGGPSAGGRDDGGVPVDLSDATFSSCTLANSDGWFEQLVSTPISPPSPPVHPATGEVDERVLRRDMGDRPLPAPPARTGPEEWLARYIARYGSRNVRVYLVVGLYYVKGVRWVDAGPPPHSLEGSHKNRGERSRHEMTVLRRRSTRRKRPEVVGTDDEDEETDGHGHGGGGHGEEHDTDDGHVPAAAARASADLRRRPTRPITATFGDPSGRPGEGTGGRRRGTSNALVGGGRLDVGRSDVGGSSARPSTGRPGSPSETDDFIYAVQYRRVEFRKVGRADFRTARLSRESEWKFLIAV